MLLSCVRVRVLVCLGRLRYFAHTGYFYACTRFDSSSTRRRLWLRMKLLHRL